MAELSLPILRDIDLDRERLEEEEALLPAATAVRRGALGWTILGIAAVGGGDVGYRGQYGCALLDAMVIVRVIELRSMRSLEEENACWGV
mmetsp:Transcript_11829/g.24958  ORF Transcript_11829/g.24958 Transcript_11829/m.24958 type:complete len:90 (-) Transcript_11829:33-302(-)